jgi:hypothetical protein
MASFAIPVSWYNFVDYYPLVTKTTEVTKGVSQAIVKLRDPRGSLNGGARRLSNRPLQRKSELHDLLYANVPRDQYGVRY